MNRLTPEGTLSMAYKGARRLALAPRLWNAASRSLPDFLILGAHKSGTTSLFHLLCRHPHVLRSLYKEVNFFNRNYQRGELWYRAHFPTERRKARARAVTVESSPLYFAAPEVPARVHALLPDCRFLVLLRNPVDRLHSHYQHHRRLGRPTPPWSGFLDGVRSCIRTDTDDADHPHLGYAAASRSRYHVILERWFALYPRERFLVLSYEETYAGMAATIARICKHVEIPPWTPDRQERRNTGSYSAMDPAARAELQELFRPANQRLFALLDRSFPWG